MKKLISYHNDKKLKELLVKEIGIHEKHDQILQGTYGREVDGQWKGCAVGCSIHSLNVNLGKRFETNDHKVYESELGIPEWLARLEDIIFEGLPKEEAMKWPKQFASAIPVGVDLEPVKWKFCAYLCKENIDRVLKLKISDELKKQVVKAITQVLTVHKKAIMSGTWDDSAAKIAESAAWSAAESAAKSAESAAKSADWSAAESAAESATYIKYSKELLKIIKNHK